MYITEVVIGLGGDALSIEVSYSPKTINSFSYTSCIIKLYSWWICGYNE
jgi:hypothetical protein